MKNISKNTKALLILWGMILISCIIIFWQFLFGDEFFVFKDVGSDTYQQYLMHYNSIINGFRDGSFSLWDFSNGFGTSLYALNLFHPLLFLLYIGGTILGPMRIPHLMVFLEIGQIFLAATVLFFYLKEFPVSCKARTAAAYIYGLNGYLLVWGQHYQFGLYVILLPLLLLAIEKMLKTRRFSFLLAFFTALTALASVYMSYMTLLATGIYLVIRILYEDFSGKERLRLLFKGCGAMIMGLGMMMAVFLPSALYILGISSRLEASESLMGRFINHLSPYSARFYESAFYRIFSSGIQGISDNYSGVINYYEAPVLFLSLLFVLLLFQYLFTIHRQQNSRRRKVIQYLTLLLVAFVVFIRAGSLIFNAFAYAFSRHTFVLMPIMALVTALMLDQVLIKKTVSRIGLIAAALALLALWLKAPANTVISVPLLVVIGLAMLGLLLLGSRRNLSARAARLIPYALVLLVMVNSVTESYATCNDRKTLKKSDGLYFEQLYGRDITDALNYLRATDPSFYRVEKDYDGASYCMDSLTQNYNGISTYNSAPNKHVQEFVNRLWPGLLRMSPSQYSYRQVIADTELASLMNIKYLLSRSEEAVVDGFTLLKQFGTIYIYQNNNTQSLGKFFTEAVTETELPEDTTLLDTDRLVSERLILNDSQDAAAAEPVQSSYQLETLDIKTADQSFSDTKKISYPLDLRTAGDYERLYIDFELHLEKSPVARVSLSDSCYRYVAADKKQTIRVRLRVPKDCKEITIAGTDTKISGTLKNISFLGSREEIQRPAPAAIDIPMPAKDTHVTGTASTTELGYLFLSIPYEDGWSATVNGEPAEILRADYGFSALKLEAGDHTLEFTYRPRGLTAGILVSVVCVGMFIVGVVGRRCRRTGVPREPRTTQRVNFR